METELPIQIRLVSPPIGVGFCLQKGKAELVDYVTSTGKDIVFKLAVRVKEGKDGSPNFLGSYAQGVPKNRFVYVCSGKRAGQLDSRWERRAKISLSGISWQQIEEVTAQAGARISAMYEATEPDGGPSCASVPLLGDGWKLSSEGET